MKTLKPILAVFLATLWISLSEFFRNQFLVQSFWTEHYNSLGLIFPSEPINGAMWGVWSLLYALAVYFLSRRFNLWQTTLLAWFVAFPMMWVVLGNLGVLPYGLLWYAVPLSLLEAFVAAWIVRLKIFRIPAIMLIIPVIIGTGCSKDNDGPGDTPCFPYTAPVHRISEIVQTSNGKTTRTLFYYDSLNRIRYIYDSGEYISNVYYTYTPDTLYLSSNDSMPQEYFYQLDSRGYAVRDKMGFNAWEYDSSGYLIKATSTYPHASTTIKHFSYSCFNNDAVTTELLDNPPYPEPASTTSKEFYYDQLNTIGNENMGTSFYGKQDNCLVKSIFIDNPSAGDSSATYTYEFDSLQRVTREIVKSSNIEVRVRTFRYY